MMDMFSEARQMAVKYREIFDAFIFAGFSEDQAMDLLITLMESTTPRG